MLRKDAGTGLHLRTAIRRRRSSQALPSPSDIEPPSFDSKAPYFTAYLRQQLVERYGAAKAFFGGLKVKSTLDLKLQEAAEEAVNSYLGYLPATASVVVIDNRNASIKAMVGGPDFEDQALQPGDAGPPPARLLDQALHAADGAGRGHLALNDLRIGAAGIPFRQERPGNVRRPQRRGLLPRLLRHHLRHDLLGQLDLRPARTRRAEGQDGRGPHPLDRGNDPQGRLRRPDLDQPGDGAGRANRRRHAAGLDLRLHDDRQQRRPRQRHPRPQTRRQPGRLHRSHRPRRPRDQGRRQRLDAHAGDQGRHRRRGEEHPRNGRLQRHRHQRPDRRRRPVGQDGDDREQRRRLVLRRRQRRSHRLRLGRLRRLDDADDHPLQRRPGDGRHLPGPDLGQA